MLFDTCYELLPYPSDPAHDKTASVTVSAPGTGGSGSANFTLSRFSSTTCEPTTQLPSSTIVLDVCHNQTITPGTGVMAWMWERAYVPPP